MGLWGFGVGVMEFWRWRYGVMAFRSFGVTTTDLRATTLLGLSVVTHSVQESGDGATATPEISDSAGEPRSKNGSTAPSEIVDSAAEDRSRE